MADKIPHFNKLTAALNPGGLFQKSGDQPVSRGLRLTKEDLIKTCQQTVIDQ